MIKINELYYKVNNKELYNGLSYEFESNHCYAIVGSNGCGKSTLLKLIMNVERKVNFAKY